MLILQKHGVNLPYKFLLYKGHTVSHGNYFLAWNVATGKRSIHIWKQVACTYIHYHQMMVYVQVSQVGGKQTTHLLNHGFIVSLLCTEQNIEKRDNTNYSYKLIQPSKQSLRLSMVCMGKVANTSGITWCANLCHLVPTWC